MSVRGPRGGRGRGRGRGGGRGGRTVVWEWESYTPGPEVYEQLWRVRREPATVTPHLSHDCPIPNAHSRILDRRQTEDKIQRNFYTVRVTYGPRRHLSASSEEEDTSTRTEVVEVDLSRILEYVSPQALEDFEHEQFNIEAAAEAEVSRQEAEELARKRLEKNFRTHGAGKGSRMLKGLGLDPDAPTRGRGRGRARGKGRGSWQGRGTTGGPNRSEEAIQEEMEEIGPLHALERSEEDAQVIVAETESEDEVEQDRRTQTSPSIIRSAFVANSALSASPVAPHRRLSTLSLAYRAPPEFLDNADSDIGMNGSNTKSTSSASIQRRLEHGYRGRTVDMSDEDSVDEDRHRNKRRRTESTASNQREFSSRMKPLSSSTPPHARTTTALNQISVSASEDVDSEDALDESVPAVVCSASRQSSPNGDCDDTIRIQISHRFDQESDEGDGEAEVFVVEAIIKHSFRNGKKHYLVKWEDYDDSYDWLPEEDLAGAPERVAEYESRAKKGKGKVR